MAPGPTAVHVVLIGESGPTPLRLGDGYRVDVNDGLLSELRLLLGSGSVRVDAPALLHKDRPAEVEIYRGGKVQSYERPLGQPIWSWSYQREAEHFIEQVRADQPFRSSGEDTLADVKLFEEIYRVYLQTRGTL